MLKESTLPRSAERLGHLFYSIFFTITYVFLLLSCSELKKSFKKNRAATPCALFYIGHCFDVFGLDWQHILFKTDPNKKTAWSCRPPAGRQKRGLYGLSLAPGGHQCVFRHHPALWHSPERHYSCGRPSLGRNSRLFKTWHLKHAVD